MIGLGWGIQATLVSTAVAEAFDLQLLPGILAFRFVTVGLSSYVALPSAGEQNLVAPPSRLYAFDLAKLVSCFPQSGAIR